MVAGLLAGHPGKADPVTVSPEAEQDLPGTNLLMVASLQMDLPGTRPQKGDPVMLPNLLGIKLQIVGSPPGTRLRKVDLVGTRQMRVLAGRQTTIGNCKGARKGVPQMIGARAKTVGSRTLQEVGTTEELMLVLATLPHREATIGVEIAPQRMLTVIVLQEGCMTLMKAGDADKLLLLLPLHQPKKAGKVRKLRQLGRLQLLHLYPLECGYRQVVSRFHRQVDTTAVLSM
jgi:hypothetical protein